MLANGGKRRRRAGCLLSGGPPAAPATDPRGYLILRERRFDPFVQGADKRTQMGEPREPERPDYSVFA